MDLSGLIAQYADFSHAGLYGANLTGEDLSGANFHRAKGIDIGSSGARNIEEVRGTDPDLQRTEDFAPFLRRK